MIPSVAFAPDIGFLIQNMDCICSRPGTHVQVVISLRLKELIAHEDWSNLRSGDLEEIRSLYELGFVVHRSP